MGWSSPQTGKSGDLSAENRRGGASLVVRCGRRAAGGWHNSARTLGRGGATVRRVCARQLRAKAGEKREREKRTQHGCEGEKRRRGGGRLGRAMWRRRAWGGGAGGRQGVRPAEAVASRASVVRSRGAGWRTWAAREGVGRSRKGGAGPGLSGTLLNLI
jgi:hypothetical protein